MPKLQIKWNNGIKPTDETPVNSPYFTTLRGGRCTESGFMAHVPFRDATLEAWLTARSIVSTWPFPQIWVGKAHTLLFTETAVYDLTESYPTSAMDVRELSDGTYTYTFAEDGGAWQCCDFDGVIVAINKTNTLILDFASTSYRGTAALLANGVCEHQGRAVFSGLTSGFWSTEWNAIVANLNSISTLPSLAMSERHVWWSQLGGADVNWLFNPTAAVYGPMGANLVKNHRFVHTGNWTAIPTATASPHVTNGAKIRQSLTLTSGAKYVVWFQVTVTSGSAYVVFNGQTGKSVTTSGVYWQEFTVSGSDSNLDLCSSATGDVTFVMAQVRKPKYDGYDFDRPFVIESLDRLDAGTYPLPWQGAAGTVLPIETQSGQCVAVYAEEGAGILVPIQEPMPTYGFRAMADNNGRRPAGICAVGGNSIVHVMVDNAGCVWRLVFGELQRLDYRHVFADATDIGVTWDDSRGDAYISATIGSERKCYCLSASGLSQVPENVISLALLGGRTVGTASSVSWTGFYAETTPFDMEYMANKLIKTVDIGSYSTTSVRASVGTSTAYVPSVLVVNGRGNFRCSGNAFKFTLLGDFGDGGRIDYATIGWEPSDSR